MIGHDLDEYISKNLRLKLHSIRIAGNRAVHQNKATTIDSQSNIKLMHDIAVALYSAILVKRGSIESSVKYGQDLIDSYQLYDKTESNSSAISTKQHESLMTEIEQKNQQLKDHLAEIANKEKAIDELTRKQNAKQSRQILDTLVFNEAQTRQYLIDSALFKAGWDIDLVNNQLMR